MIDQRDVLAEMVGVSSLTKKPIAERTKFAEVANDPIVIPSNETLRSAIRLMMENNIGILPVVDENDNLVAVFSERDAFKAIANGASLDSPLIDYATKKPEAIRCEDPVSRAAEIVTKLGIRHVVGTDIAGRVRCVASVKDILKLG